MLFRFFGEAVLSIVNRFIFPDTAYESKDGRDILSLISCALAEGRSEGINELSKAVKLLRTGSTAQELLNKGFAQDIVTSATALLSDIG